MKIVNLSEKIYFYNISTIDTQLKAGLDIGRLFVKTIEFFSFLKLNLERVFAWMERARQREALLRLDDHLLSDIGLSRHQVYKESSKKFWQA